MSLHWWWHELNDFVFHKFTCWVPGYQHYCFWMQDLKEISSSRRWSPNGGRICEDLMRRHPSSNHKEGLPQNLNQPAHWSWNSQTSEVISKFLLTQQVLDIIYDSLMTKTDNNIKINSEWMRTLYSSIIIFYTT
jgi:hypothetical protein